MDRLTVLQISPSDVGGGAEKVALDLVQLLCERGVDAWLGVDRKLSGNPRSIALPRKDRRQSLAASIGSGFSTHPSKGLAYRLLSLAAHPLRSIEQRIGIDSGGVRKPNDLLRCPPRRPDVIHIHNLHGNYVGLDTVQKISTLVPTLLTLHDQWPITGHCAYSFDCTRWKTSCGRCPYPDVYPRVTIDVTRLNRFRKAYAYTRSRLFVASPSKWLLDCVDDSVLARGVVEKRLIPNGVDRSVFRPGTKSEARKALGLPDDAIILLTTSNRLTTNEFKDWPTLEEALRLIPTAGRQIVALVVGDEGRTRYVGNVRVAFRGMERHSSILAQFYQAADLFILPTKADNHPLSILESLACGTPVVASDLGGIPEQVRPLHLQSLQNSTKSFGPADATGILVPPQNAPALAAAVALLTDQPLLLSRMGANASADAAIRFDINKQADSYLEWYRHLAAPNKTA